MFSAVAVGLQLERRLESSERFMFPIARPLPLRSWFSRFLLGSGNLQFKTQSDAATGPGKSLLKWRLLLSRPDLLYQVTWVGIESNYHQLCFLFLFVCYLKGFPSQKKWLSGGFRNITCLTASHLSLSLSHTHIHTHTPWQWLVDMAAKGQPLCFQLYSLCHNSSTQGWRKPHSGWAHSTA